MIKESLFEFQSCILLSTRFPKREIILEEFFLTVIIFHEDLGKKCNGHATISLFLDILNSNIFTSWSKPVIAGLRSNDVIRLEREATPALGLNIVFGF